MVKANHALSNSALVCGDNISSISKARNIGVTIFKPKIKRYKLNERDLCTRKRDWGDRRSKLFLYASPLNTLWSRHTLLTKVSGHLMIFSELTVHLSSFWISSFGLLELDTVRKLSDFFNLNFILIILFDYIIKAFICNALKAFKRDWLTSAWAS